VIPILLLGTVTLTGCAGAGSRDSFPDCRGCMFERRRP